MNAAAIMDVSRDAIVTFLKVGGPTLLVALAVGLGVSLVQALTQIQEQTLIFVPKVIAVFGVMLLTMPFMGDALGAYMVRLADRIASGG